MYETYIRVAGKHHYTVLFLELLPVPLLLLRGPRCQFISELIHKGRALEERPQTSKSAKSALPSLIGFGEAIAGIRHRESSVGLS